MSVDLREKQEEAEEANAGVFYNIGNNRDALEKDETMASEYGIRR